MNKCKTGHGWPHDVTRKDLEIKHVRGSGAGGQKRNKTSSGVVIKHLPTGLWARSDEERMQHVNLASAFRKLAVQLVPLMKKEERKQRYGAGTDKRIRTYHGVDNRVVDERIGFCGTYDEVINGSTLVEMLERLSMFDPLTPAQR